MSFPWPHAPALPAGPNLPARAEAQSPQTSPPRPPGQLAFQKPRTTRAIHAKYDQEEAGQGSREALTSLPAFPIDPSASQAPVSLRHRSPRLSLVIGFQMAGSTRNGQLYHERAAPCIKDAIRWKPASTRSFNVSKDSHRVKRVSACGSLCQSRGTSSEQLTRDESRLAVEVAYKYPLRPPHHLSQPYSPQLLPSAYPSDHQHPTSPPPAPCLSTSSPTSAAMRFSSAWALSSSPP